MLAIFLLIVDFFPRFLGMLIVGMREVPFQFLFGWGWGELAKIVPQKCHHEFYTSFYLITRVMNSYRKAISCLIESQLIYQLKQGKARDHVIVK